MDKWQKIFNVWKHKNERWLSADKAKDLVGVLVANGITEDELTGFGDQLKKELKDIIFRMNKTESEKDDWLRKMEKAFDSAHAQHFPGSITLEVADTTPPEELAARKIGYTKDYLDMVKNLPRVKMSDG